MSSPRQQQKDELLFHLDLQCTSNSKEIPCVQVIKFDPSVPPTKTSDIISKLEDTLDIPGSAMSLEMNSLVLKEEDHLDSLKLRSGDTITVKYYSVANCSKVNECLDAMQSIKGKLEEWEKGDYRVSSLRITRQEGLINDYAIDLFSKWTDPHNYANKVHFITRDGLKLIVDILRLISDVPTYRLPIELQIIEIGLLSCLVNIAEDGHIRRLVIASGAIERCVKTLLRYPIQCQHPQTNCDNIIKFIILESLGVLANLCEIPKASLDICSRDNVIKQMYSVILHPDFDFPTVHRVYMTLIDLSYCPQNHRALVVQDEFGDIIKCNQSKVTHERQPLIRFNKSVFAAILTLMSPQLFLDEHDTSKTTNAMLVEKTIEDFASRTDFWSLSYKEKTLGIYWGTLIPLIEVLYTSHSSDGKLGDLSVKSKKTIVITLLSLLLREYHRDILVKEGMVDYVLCLPWHTPKEVQAKALGDMIIGASDVPYQPPSLLNMCKAAVAVYHCGLHDVMRLSVPELANKLWTST